MIKISIIVGILLISCSISYYYVLFIPKQEKAKSDLVNQKDAELKQKEEVRQSNLEACLSTADAEHRDLEKANGKGPKLSMPLELAKAIDKKHNDERNDCYKQYPPLKQ
jgi:hypothetical protein